jgi:hypothetical protein
VRDALDSETADKLDVEELQHLLNCLDSRFTVTLDDIHRTIGCVKRMSPDDNSQEEVDADDFLFALANGGAQVNLNI